MVHTVVGEADLEGQLNHLSSQPFASGLVLGQRTKVRDLVVHLAPTPSVSQDSADAVPVNSVETLDVPWMLEHYKQITRMLPGGIGVIGAFIVDSSDIFQSATGMTHVRKLLKSVATKECLEGNDFVVLHLDRRTKKVTIKTVDTSPTAGQGLKAAEFKLLQEEKDPAFGWQKVEGTFLLDVPIAFNQADSSELLQEKIEKALKPLQKCIDSAVVLFDNSFRTDGDMLDPTAAPETGKQKGKGKKGRGKDMDDDEDEDDLIKRHRVDILLQEDVGESGGDCELMSMHSRMKLSGRLSLCSFLHARATVGEAIAAVKADLLRSLRGRLQMHCDSLIGEETKGAVENEVPVLHEPPRRILVKLPSSDVCICDYLFPGETTYDSNDSVEELFGFKPRIEDMDDDLELVAVAPRDNVGSESGDESRTSSPGLDSKQQLLLESAAHCSPSFLAVCVGVALLGVALAYFALFPTWSSQKGEEAADIGGGGGGHPKGQ